ncbi:MAG TPA: formylglycine-generating enzyme family protein, partial [Pirellulales bacterium]
MAKRIWSGLLVVLASLVVRGNLLLGAEPAAGTAGPAAFRGSKAGDERTVVGLKLCWCPAGTFTMGSPPTEPERRPGEDQVRVTLTKGF